MKNIIYILNKVFVIEFYRLNAGFLLLVIGFCFGFMSGVEHKALAQFFISSPFLLAIPIFIWFLYTLKVIQFNRQALALQQNEFVFHFSLLSKFLQWITTIQVLFGQMTLVIGYSLFLILTALKENLLSPVIYIILSVFLLIGFSTYILIHDLNSPNQEKKIWTIKRYFDKLFKKQYPQFFIGWITRRDLATLVGSKIFSCLLLLGVIHLYRTDVYDSRLLGLGISISFSINAMMVYHYHQFENRYFSFLHNLPFSLAKRLYHFTITFALLTCIELSILITDFPTSLELINLPGFILFGMSIPFLHFTILYIRDRGMEQFTRIVFGLSVFWIILILFKISILLIAALNIIVATAIFKRYYYSFEFISTIPKEQKE